MAHLVSLNRITFRVLFLALTPLCRSRTSQTILVIPSRTVLVKVYVNDLLDPGCIPDVYTKDEQRSVSEGLIEVVKAKGIPPEPSACWDYFIRQVCIQQLCVARGSRQNLLTR